jgi:hypothetical protein
MGTLGKALLFASDRFDSTSELPEDANAGNRFHGRDLAAWLCERLKAKGLAADFFDEDWGWLVFGKAAPAIDYEIGVYHLESEGAGPPEWGLQMRATRREKLFWRFHKTVKVAVPPAVDAAVADALAAIGADPHPWEDGPRA